MIDCKSTLPFSEIVLKPVHNASRYLRTSFVLGFAAASFTESEIALYNSSSVVKIFSISDELFASCNEIVLTSMFGLGRRRIFLFSSANALLAIPQLKSTSLSITSGEGGSEGKSLYGVSLSKVIFLFMFIFMVLIGHDAKICPFLESNIIHVQFFKITGHNIVICPDECLFI